jgi:hypothetical protein
MSAATAVRSRMGVASASTELLKRRTSLCMSAATAARSRSGVASASTALRRRRMSLVTSAATAARSRTAVASASTVLLRRRILLATRGVVTAVTRSSSACCPRRHGEYVHGDAARDGCVRWQRCCCAVSHRGSVSLDSVSVQWFTLVVAVMCGHIRRDEDAVAVDVCGAAVAAPTA